MCCKCHNKGNLIVNEITKEIVLWKTKQRECQCQRHNKGNTIVDFLCYSICNTIPFAMSLAMRFPLFCHWQCNCFCQHDFLCYFIKNTISFAVAFATQFLLLFHLQCTVPFAKLKNLTGKKWKKNSQPDFWPQTFLMHWAFLCHVIRNSISIAVSLAMRFRLLYHLQCDFLSFSFAIRS